MRASILVTLVASLAACAAPAPDLGWLRERAGQVFGPQGGFDVAAEGEEALPAQPTLADVLAYGLTHNPGLRATFERWRAALERIVQASALPDPSFSFAHFVEELQTRTGPQRNRFGLSQTLPWFGKLALRGEVAAKKAEALWHRVRTQRLALVRRIKDAWFEYGFLAHAIRISSDQLELLKQLEPIAQRKIQGGGRQDDLLRLQVEIGKVENSLETLRQLRPALSAKLDAALNRRKAGLLPLPTLAEPRARDVDAQVLRKRLLAANPELAELREVILAAQRRTELARLDPWPDVTLGVDYFDTGGALSPAAPGSGDDPVALRIGFRLPIQRETYAAAEREARREEASASLGLLDRENTLAAELALALYRLDDAARQIVLYRETLLPRARQALAVTRTSYEGGKATILDVIDSERVLLSFDKSYWRASADYEQSLAEIESITGGEVR